MATWVRLRDGGLLPVLAILAGPLKFRLEAMALDTATMVTINMATHHDVPTDGQTLVGEGG